MAAKISVKRKAYKKIIFWSVLLAVLSALFAGAFYTGLTVRHYDIITDKLSPGESLRIVVIADLHSVYYGEDQEQLISRIEKQEPDIIALVGDIIDDNTSEDGAIVFLEGIQGIAPTYYVIGNHEIWSGKYRRMKDIVESFGYTVLTNESMSITVNGIDICISGVDDPEILDYSNEEEYTSAQSYQELLYTFNDLDAGVFNVLLAHRPELYNLYQQYGFDLVLSGHAHGGQIRIPGLINGLFAPDQGFFPKYAGGEYKENGQTMIVSRGLSFDERVPRVFNPPEIVVIDISND